MYIDRQHLNIFPEKIVLTFVIFENAPILTEKLSKDSNVQSISEEVKLIIGNGVKRPNIYIWLVFECILLI